MSQLDRLISEQAAVSAATQSIRAYVEAIFDQGSFVEINAFAKGQSRIDGAPIAGEGVLCGTATLCEQPFVVIAQNADAFYGSFGKAQADKICRAFALAAKHNMPVLSVLDSFGARVGEGVEVLEGYGAVLKAASGFADQNGLHFCVVKGQAAGLFATFAQIATVRLMDAKASMSVLSPAVLDAEGQSSAATTEACAKAGAVDYVCEGADSVVDVVSELWRWYAPVFDSDDDPNRETPALQNETDFDTLVSALVDDGDYLEYRALQGGAVRCLLAHINTIPVGVVVNDVEGGNVMRADDCRKLVGFARLLYRTGSTLVTLVNSDGFVDASPELAADTADLANYIADDGLTKIAVCVGHAVGNAYTLLASKGIGFDYSVAFAGAVVSPVSPRSAVHLMYADVLRAQGNTPAVREKLASMYADEHCDAYAAAAKGYIDEVIHPASLRPYVANALFLVGADE